MSTVATPSSSDGHGDSDPVHAHNPHLAHHFDTPEQQIAFFGGDSDNFEYPRFDLDMCFFRVYENDKAVQPEHYLKWSANGSAADELVFVSGHPGRTNRQNTMAELEYLRDTGYPFLLQRLNRMEVLMGSWSERWIASITRV